MASPDKLSASGLPGKFGEAIDLFLAKSIGISPVYFDCWRQETDWATIIKLHAFIEATLNRLLVSHFRDERLYPIISRLDVSDQKKGKLAFVKALNLLPSEWRSFIKQFSEIRNSLVHDVKNIEFSLKKYWEELGSQKRKDFKGVIAPIMCEIIQGFTKERIDKQIEDHFKVTLVVCVASIMMRVHASSGTKSNELPPSESDQSTPKEP